MTRTGWTLGSALALALSCGSALAQTVVFQQDPAGASIMGPFANMGHNISTQRVADNFTLGTPAAVSQINFWGWTYVNQTGQQSDLSNISGFDIRIMEADGPGGAPETVVYQEVVPTSLIVVSNYAAGPLAGQTCELHAPLSATVSLGAGTTYWVAINAVVINPNNNGALFVWTEIPTGAAGPDIAADGTTVLDGIWDLLDTAYNLTFEVLALSDSDNDGLSDTDEAFFGSNPNDPDTDGDGLLDGTEVDLFGNGSCVSLLDPDSDDDTLSDGEEVDDLGTDPCSGDTDGDGIPDAIDQNPLISSTSNAQVAEAIRATGDLVLMFDLEAFSAPNANAAAARRNALANRFYAAAFFAQNGLDLPAALLILTADLRIDGDPFPPDWMLDTADRDVLRIFVDDLIDLLV